MFRYPVLDSENIKSVGYSVGTLEIEFHSGGVYRYFNVPVDVYNSLMNAPSKGKYFARSIRGRYPESKIL